MDANLGGGGRRKMVAAIEGRRGRKRSLLAFQKNE